MSPDAMCQHPHIKSHLWELDCRWIYPRAITANHRLPHLFLKHVTWYLPSHSYRALQCLKLHR